MQKHKVEKNVTIEFLCSIDHEARKEALAE